MIKKKKKVKKIRFNKKGKIKIIVLIKNWDIKNERDKFEFQLIGKSVEEMATVRLLHLRSALHRHGVAPSPPPPWRLLTLSNRVVRSFSSALSPPSKAVVYDEQGAPDAVCRVKELPPVPINDEDVCVRMLASPINPSDINRIEGFPSLFVRFCRLFLFTALVSCTVLAESVLGVQNYSKLKW